MKIVLNITLKFLYTLNYAFCVDLLLRSKYSAWHVPAAPCIKTDHSDTNHVVIC